MFYDSDSSGSSSDDELDEMIMQLIILRRRRVKKNAKRTRKSPRFWVRNIFQHFNFFAQLSSSTNDKIVAMFFKFSLYTHTHQIQTENDPRKEKCAANSRHSFDVFLNYELT